jgi:hypothetical protein
MIIATLTGIAPEYVDPEKICYSLGLAIVARPRSGVPSGHTQSLSVQERYYGPGQPGISAETVDKQVVAELQRVLKFGK